MYRQICAALLLPQNLVDVLIYWPAILARLAEPARRRRRFEYY